MLFSNLVAVIALAAPAFAISAPHAEHAASVDKREVQRQTIARVALAKARAARQAKRSLSSEENLAERDLSAGMSKLVARARPGRCDLRNFRGSQDRADRYCKTFFDTEGTKVTYNKRVATAACVDSLCEISCPAGYAQVNTDTSVTCIKNAASCGGQDCVSPNSNTEVMCVNNKCTVTGCYNGFTLNRNKDQCINLSTDPSNCGRERVRCRASYDRKYSGACSRGSCTFACPRGLVQGRGKGPDGGETCIVPQ